MQKEKTMNDGSTAHITQSQRYYCRKEPNKDNWTKIIYYTLRGRKIQLAKAKCKKCMEVIESQRCGHFVKCQCGESYVDTDRWFPELHRYGGECEQVK